MQLLHLQFLLLFFSSISFAANPYEANEFINLNDSICDQPNKHLTIKDSGFFEYIGAGKERIFECGESPELGNEPCRTNSELICRNKYKEHIIKRSDSLIMAANKLLDSSENTENQKKLINAVRKHQEINQSWKNSKDNLALIKSLEREIISTASLLPPQVYKSINQELRSTHDKKRLKILEQQRSAEETRIKKQEEALAKNQEFEERINLILIIIGIAAIIVLLGFITNRWICFDSEKDFYMTIGLLICSVIFVGVLGESSGAATFSGRLFYWSVILVSGALTVFLFFTTLSTSIKGNGIFVGLFTYIFKILFMMLMTLFILGKISEIMNNKDGRTRANKAPLLAIFALLVIFWKPVQYLFINGDKVRAKREASQLN